VKKRVLLLSLALLAAALLVLVFQDFFRDSIIIPIAYNLWLLRLELESLPHIVPWAILIVILMLVAHRTLSTRRTAQQRKLVPLALRRRGRVEVWATWLHLTRRGDYFRWNLAQQLAQLSVTTLAHLENMPADTIRKRVIDGDIEMPPDVHSYLSAGLHYRYRGRFTRLLDRLLRRTQPAPTDLNPEQVIAFIEAQMGEDVDYPNR